VELTLKSLSLQRHGRTVLKNVSAEISQTGLTCLLGTNGTGKTTLLRILCGELKPDSGTFLLGDTDAAGLGQPELSRYFSIIPQKSPAPAYLTVSEMVALARFQPQHSLWWTLNKEDEGMLNAAIELCEIGQFRAKKVTELSGGEQQRVWLAFGLASNKPFLILDETLDGMDIFAKRGFFRLLKKVSSETKGIILATHYLGMLGQYADKTIILRDGEVVFEGSASVDMEQYMSGSFLNES